MLNWDHPNVATFPSVVRDFPLLPQPALSFLMLAHSGGIGAGRVQGDSNNHLIYLLQ